MDKLLFLFLSITLLFKGYYCITGGYKAYAGAVPYHAAIFYDGSYRCGGTLLDNSWVITSASCVDRAKRVQVLLGATNVKAFEAFSKSMDVRCIVFHPQYTSDSLNFNIALLRLATEVTPHFNVLAIDLANYVPVPGETVALSGFGETMSDSKSSVLQTVVLKVLSNKSCKRSFRFLFVSVKENEMCTEGSWVNSAGACKGDEGSPLVALHGYPSLVGMVNFGSYLCNGVLPTIYTSIFPYKQWIEDNQQCPGDPYIPMSKSLSNDTAGEDIKLKKWYS